MSDKNTIYAEYGACGLGIHRQPPPRELTLEEYLEFSKDLKELKP